MTKTKKQGYDLDGVDPRPISDRLFPLPSYEPKGDSLELKPFYPEIAKIWEKDGDLKQYLDLAAKKFSGNTRYEFLQDVINISEKLKEGGTFGDERMAFPRLPIELRGPDPNSRFIKM